VQGRGDEAADVLKADARALSDAGAAMIVLELMPSAVASAITREVSAITIGIGAGPDCHGQVLVLHDALGLAPKPARFVRDFMQGADGIAHAARRFVEAVRDASFPDRELHTY
jgi:3-methyl-2-oxobutanoate hydroxymethyltransferase